MDKIADKIALTDSPWYHSGFLEKWLPCLEFSMDNEPLESFLPDTYILIALLIFFYRF